jgi:hypothetical protein
MRLMEWLGEPLPFLRIAHNAHASEGGTNVMVGELAKHSFRSEQAGEFATTDSTENGTWESLLRDMRQGIASRRRHVAPALLLC